MAEQVLGQGLLWMTLCRCGRADRLHPRRRRGCQLELLKPSVWGCGAGPHTCAAQEDGMLSRSRVTSCRKAGCV